MKKELYHAIKNRLINRVSSLKSIDLFNNQFATERKINPIKYPAAFVEFESFDWKQQGRGIQIGTAVVKLHIGVETYATNISGAVPALPNDDEFFDLIAAVHLAMNSFDGDFFTPFSRVSESQDVDHDNVMIWVATYATQITDDGSEVRFVKPLINLVPDQIPSIGLNLSADFADQ